MRRWRRAGWAMVLCSLLTLAVIATVAGSRLVVAPLEARSRALTAAEIRAHAQEARAIIVLGAGRVENAPEYAGLDIPSLRAMQRLRYGAHLHRQTGLPILISGGSPSGHGESEAALMARLLKDDFNINVRWLEEKSVDTAGNARHTAGVLHSAGIHRALLVTDALHMPRARMMFSLEGFEVIAAPTLFFGHERLGPNDFLPGGEGLALTHAALREWLGIAWYRLRSAR